MPLSLTKINYKTFLINLLFSFIPISFIAGNLILNLNVLLFIIFSVVFYGKNILSLRFNNLDKIILIFLLTQFLLEFLIIFTYSPKI